MQTGIKVVKNIGILYIRVGLSVFISLYSTRLILSALGENDFGIFNVIAGAVVMLTFLNAAMSASSLRFMSYAQGEGNITKLKNIFNVSIIIHAAVAIILFFILEGAGYFLFEYVLDIPENRIKVANLIFHFAVISTVFTIFSVPYDATLNAHENMLFIAILAFINVVIKLLIAIYVTYTSYDKLVSYGILMVLLSGLLFIIRYCYCSNKYAECHINIRKYFNKPLFNKMTTFAGWSFLATSTSMLSSYGQGLVINKFFGTLANAAQGVAVQLGAQITGLASVLLKALNPVIAKSEGAGNRDLMLKASIMGSKVTFFLLMFFFIPLLLETPFILSLWLKKVPEFAVVFCQLFIIRSLIEQLFITLVTSISAVGDIKRYKIIASILCVWPLIVSYILFARGFPVYYIYIVFIIYSILDSIIILYFSKKICGLSILYFIKNNVIRGVGSFIIVLISSYIPILFMNEGFYRFYFIISINIATYFGTVLLIGFNIKERQDIIQIMQPVINKINSKYK